MIKRMTSSYEPPSLPQVLDGEIVTFTGTLASMTHLRAGEFVVAAGGEPSQHLTRHTTILVVGEEGWPLEADGKPSQKYQQALSWNAEGRHIRIFRESEWLQLLGLSDFVQGVHRLYTPAMLAQMLSLPVSVIRRWEQLGLIYAVKRIARLPYFDFQEVARLGRLSQLLESGVPRAQLERSLAAIEELFPEADRPRALLPLLRRGQAVMTRDDHGLIEPISRQRFFGFEDARDEEPVDSATPTSLPFPFQQVSHAEPCATAEGWFQRGCELLEEHGDADGAIEAFRMSLMLDPNQTQAHLCLADALYHADLPDAALERYYAVVERDRNFVEAWTQIGCLHVSREEYHPAVAAFRIALDIHPDYPDAHLHLAETLFALGETRLALPHWQRYLEFDDRGPWADMARQRLGMEPVEHEATTGDL